jgi:hypothetical protein
VPPEIIGVLPVHNKSQQLEIHHKINVNESIKTILELHIVYMYFKYINPGTKEQKVNIDKNSIPITHTF